MNISDVRSAYNERISFKIFYIFILVLILIFLFVLSLNIGSSDMKMIESLEVLLGRGQERNAYIVRSIRLPRALAGLVIGMSLALSGLVLQATLNNPLASPSSLGISNASAFGANVALIVMARMGIETSSAMTALVSFLSALLCTILILSISRLKGSDRTSIILAGVAFNSLFGAGTTVIQYFADESELASVVFWTFGDLGRINFKELGLVTIIVFISIIIIYRMRWQINAMDMGEEGAHSLGVDVGFLRNISILIAAINTGVSVAFVGVISFVGLIAPQITVRIIGEDKRFMIPASLLLGSIIVLVSDCLARTLAAPLVLPVGAITAFMGAPLFLYILIKED